MQTAHIDPDLDAWTIFKTLPWDEPLQMLNLIRLRPHADYPPDHPDHGKGLSGLEAYRAWGRTTAPLLKRVGGRQIWIGKPEVMLIGPGTEAWDLAFIVDYSSAKAFLAMNKDPEYRECVKHRTAAVADSRLLRLSHRIPGEGFGETAEGD